MQSHGLAVDLYCVLVSLILLNIFRYMHYLMEEKLGFLYLIFIALTGTLA